MKKYIKNCLFILFFTFSLYLNAEVVSSSKFEYTIDFPEGFFIEDMSKDERSILFKNNFFPIQAIIRIWESDIFLNAKENLKYTMEKLNAEGEIAETKWRNQSCAISQISIKKNSFNENMKGWAISVPLHSKDFFTMLLYAPQEKSNDLEQIILSVLDSIIIDQGCYTEAGIITNFAFPKTNQEKIEINVNNRIITSYLNQSDKEANQFVIDREFAVFKFYSTTKFWKESWQRFYRLIAKDSIGRTKRLSFDIYANLYEDALTKKVSNINLYIAQEILYWVQSFNYQRKSSDPNKADYSNLVDTIKNNGSDCDSRSLLAMVLLKNMNIDACMFISVAYSHAMLGVCIPDTQGQTFKLDNKEYLFGETTQKNLTLGKIASDMQDRKKWIPVEMY